MSNLRSGINLRICFIGRCSKHVWCKIWVTRTDTSTKIWPLAHKNTENNCLIHPQNYFLRPSTPLLQNTPALSKKVQNSDPKFWNNFILVDVPQQKLKTNLYVQCRRVVARLEEFCATASQSSGPIWKVWFCAADIFYCWHQEVRN